MSLFELFRQKQIHITPESAVKANYLTVQSVLELYALAEGDLLLVKRQITPEDARWLQSYGGSRIVFAMQPESLESFDAKKGLSFPVYTLNSVGLNYLHFGDALFVFDDMPEKGQQPEIPNVIRLSPVHRNEIETQLSINMDAIMAALVAKQSASEAVGPGAEGSAEGRSREQEKQSGPKEIDLLRKKLGELFSSRYTEVRAEFSGTSPEYKTIPLSGFYKKNGIERGQLRGSWSLFEKEKLQEILDVGIVNRAKEAEFKRLTVAIPTYGRIIRSRDVEKLRSRMEGIKQDYKDYLDGKEDCKKVGSIPVETKYSPSAAVEESLARLEEYLRRLGSQRDSDSKYYRAVDELIFRERWKQKIRSDKVDLQFTGSIYTEDQWSSRDFIDRFWKTVQDNRDFFEEDFKNLLDRYVVLFYREEEKKQQEDT